MESIPDGEGNQPLRGVPCAAPRVGPDRQPDSRSAPRVRPRQPAGLTSGLRLATAAMIQRATMGTVEEPGRNVAAKSGLNRSILDQGWGAFAQMLAYKLTERGGQLLLVRAHHSSQTCSVCGRIQAANRLSRDAFRCVVCGHAEHAEAEVKGAVPAPQPSASINAGDSAARTGGLNRPAVGQTVEACQEKGPGWREPKAQSAERRPGARGAWMEEAEGTGLPMTREPAGNREGVPPMARPAREAPDFSRGEGVNSKDSSPSACGCPGRAVATNATVTLYTSSPFGYRWKYVGPENTP